jgi:hypothetical protein
MQEAEVAIREVLEQSQPVELTPQNNYCAACASARRTLWLNDRK